tara:strand:+ start:443 stop:811 length:369 start_codon:yes stop_codon:yes gene_type:complete
MNKSVSAYKTIGEVVKILDLKTKKGSSLSTHTIRYWEREFKQLKPKILNGRRRYYDEKNINTLKKIQFLLKEKGMTIKGVKRVLNNEKFLKLDESLNSSIRTANIKNKLTKISNIIKDLKDI